MLSHRITPARTPAGSLSRREQNAPYFDDDGSALFPSGIRRFQEAFARAVPARARLSRSESASYHPDTASVRARGLNQVRCCSLACRPETPPPG